MGWGGLAFEALPSAIPAGVAFYSMVQRFEADHDKSISGPLRLRAVRQRVQLAQAIGGGEVSLRT